MNKMTLKKTKKPNNISLNKIKKILKPIKHPAINDTLFNLGIIKNIEIKNSQLTILLAFPFANIPIKEKLIALVKEPLIGLGLDIRIKTSVMNQKELQKFLTREQKYWRN